MMNKKTFLAILIIFANLKATDHVVRVEKEEVVGIIKDLSKIEYVDFKGGNFSLRLQDYGQKEKFNSILNRFIMDNNDERGLLIVSCEAGNLFRFACATLDQPELSGTWTKFQVEKPTNFCFTHAPKNWWRALGKGGENKILYIRVYRAAEAEYLIV